MMFGNTMMNLPNCPPDVAGFASAVKLTDVYPLRRCCLASAYLVSRICNNCPLQVFKSSELTSVLSNLLYRGWNLPKLLDNSQTDVLTNGNVNSSPEDPLILNNGNNVISNLLNSNCLQSRIICLGSFESLCSHHESSISALFIKTLTPQVFRWLYDLTKIVEMHSASSSKDQQQQYQQKQQKLFDKSSDIYHNQINLEELTICLNTSFDLLTSLINKAENSNRQALLLIYLSLLCNLLSNESSMLSNQCHSKSSTLFIPYNSSDLFYFIHTITLKHVITIAPCFPNEFRSAFQILGDLKQRLENAIKLSTPLTNTNAAVSGGGGGGGGGSHGNNNNMSVQNQLKSHVIKGIPFNAYHQNNRSVMTKQSQVSSPSIKLKTDFSNFT
ncbi:unnamed protein product [Trichobilharzia regenti]|nr:unnamed protein product [Trichobilharzia regenti]